jgi:hypothetical protein
MRTEKAGGIIAAILWFMGSLAATQAAGLNQELKIGDLVLQLNGAGSRSKAFVELYESGLYLQQPSRDAESILAGDQPMAIRVRITSGFVSKSALTSSLMEGLEKSTGGKTADIRGDIEKFQAFLSDDVKKHDIYDFVYLPGKGLYVVKNGAIKGLVPGLAFKKALFGVWLSQDPVDPALKQAMLSSTNIR